MAGRTTAMPSATVAAGSSSAGPAGAPSQARANGWQRSACTPTRRGRRSARPQLTSSAKPFSRATNVGPSPTGTAIRSGTLRPSCSQTSSATVFFASMVYGLAPVLRSSQPNAWAAARERSTAAA